MSTNTVLRDLRPDTGYKVTLVPVYDDMEGKRTSENGKTSEFSLRVCNPAVRRPNVTRFS